jgi:DinB superfamily
VFDNQRIAQLAYPKWKTMSATPGPSFRQEIAAVHQHLSSVSEQDSHRPVRDGGWSRKEVLGHLIDSALNNHQRFVRASLDGSYDGPSYEQQGWVAMHGYASMPWNDLLEHWREQNELLCEVVDRIPENRLEAPCRIGGGAPVTLQFLVQDYLTHLLHHVNQIVRPKAAS